jgi:hypothetical protein
MRKKILIGSMLVLTLLLLMPSIPAIQQKTINDRVLIEFVEELEDVKSTNQGNEVLKFLILLSLFTKYMVRARLGLTLMFISSDLRKHMDTTGEPTEIYFPLVYLRGETIYETSIDLFGYYLEKVEEYFE